MTDQYCGRTMLNRIRYYSALFLCILYALYVLTLNFNHIEEGYRITVLLPLCFLVCFYGLLWNAFVHSRTPFAVMYCAVAFIRYVVLSLVTLQHGTFIGESGVPPQQESLTLAAILMMWELIAVSIGMYYWSKRSLGSHSKKQHLISQANPYYYLLFVIIAFFLVAIIPETRQGISFFGQVSDAMNEEIGSLLILGIREVFINAKYFLLFFVILILRKNNEDFHKNPFLSYCIAILISVLLIGLRIGANRKKLLSDALSSGLLLYSLFPRYRKSTIIGLFSLGVSLVAITTVYRGMTESSASFFLEYFDLDFLQPYFLGQYNIAISIESTYFFPDRLTAGSYIWSFLRPLFGIGSLVKEISFVSAKLMFDGRMSAGLHFLIVSMINPMIGEGYILLGGLFAPLFSVITVRCGILLDAIYQKSNRIEYVFMASTLAFYFAQGMILNTTILLNHLSYRLVIYLPVVYFSCFKWSEFAKQKQERIELHGR